ncbi:MAG: hypothetical protein HRK26_03145 [Rickettsiaceae bacterium H1]|nr:hypothetical protein [Rickettsiaceae bacterium H1]
MISIISFKNEKENKFLWFPVLISTGIIFSHQFTFFAFLLLTAIAVKKSNITIIIVLIMVGIVAINLRILLLNMKFIDKPLYIKKTMAKVHEINHKIGYSQLTLKNIKNYPLQKIRIKTYRLSEKIKSGDLVLFSAKLMPPPKAIAPYAYDFAYLAYFDGINAIGFATYRAGKIIF